MQIRLTVVDPLGPSPQRGRAASRDVLVTAPAGTELAAVASALAGAVTGEGGQGGRDTGGATVVLYAGTDRLDPRRATLGEPPLVDGAVLSLGAPAAAEPHPELDDAPAQLHVIAGPDAGGVHLLHGGRITVGRSAEADVPLDDLDVSRLHCVVTVGADGRVSVADLGSTNGTSLDGVRLTERPVRFPAGGLLRIGESALRVTPSGGPGARVRAVPDGEGCVRVVPGGARPAADTGPPAAPAARGASPVAGGVDGSGAPGGAVTGTGAAGEPVRGGSGRAGGAHHDYDSSGSAGWGASGGGAGAQEHRRGQTPVVPGQAGAPHAESRERDAGAYGAVAGAGAFGVGASGADASTADAYGAGASGVDASAADAYGAGASGADASAADAYGAGASGADASAADAYGAGAFGADASGAGPGAGPGAGSGGDTHAGRFGVGGAGAAHAGENAHGGGRKDTPLRGTDAPQGTRRRGFGAWARRLTGARGEQPSSRQTHDGTAAATAGAPVPRAFRQPETWPDPAALLLTALGPGPRLWERGPGHPEALTVRLGTADRSAPDGSGLLPAVPVTAALREAGALGLAGPRPRLSGLARAVLAQLAALHSPDLLEIVLISADRSRPVAERTAEWAWLGWLPHVRPGHGQDCRLLLAYDREQAAARTEELLRRVEDHAATGRTAAHPSPARIADGTAPTGAPGTPTPSGTPGPGTPGSSTPSPGTPGSSTPSPGTPGSSTPGPGTPGSGTPGPGTPGSSTPGPGTPGSGTSGAGTPGSGTPARGTASSPADLPAPGTPDPSYGRPAPDAGPGTLGSPGGPTAPTDTDTDTDTGTGILGSPASHAGPGALRASGGPTTPADPGTRGTPTGPRTPGSVPSDPGTSGSRSNPTVSTGPRSVGGPTAAIDPETLRAPGSPITRTGPGTLGSPGSPATPAAPVRRPSWARDGAGPDGGGGFAGPFTVVVVDGDPGGAGLQEALARLAVAGPRAGVHVVCLAETEPASPASPVARTYEAACEVTPTFRHCGAVALLSGDVAAALQLLRVARGGPVGPGVPAAVDAVSAAWAERFARAMAPLRPDGPAGERHTRVSVPLPQSARLLDELGLARATPASLMARWADAADDTESLGGRARAVLGAGPRGPVTADLVAEGPHLLIEGPPGSGRTELLRAVVASLAAAERPDRLAVVLLDGRDGVGAGAGRGEGLRVCTDIPHATTHLIANDPVRMREFAQSLTAELKRRAELLGRTDFAQWHAGREVSGRMVAQRTPAAGDTSAPADAPAHRASASGDIEAPPSSTLRLRPARARQRADAPPPLPRLVVVVDDLDALVSPALGSPGRPAAGSVMRALEAVAREGARLGVHLVAAAGAGGRTAESEPARRAALRVTLDAPQPGPDEPAPGRGRLVYPDGRAVGFQGGRVTGRIPRTATQRPTVVPLDWQRMGDPPARRPVRELGNGPTDLALLASAVERAAREVAAAEIPSLL
ncbi:FHA domain-containing protein [Streptomyces actinomycinicus]|uniref:FHA domain-containing protein n=1 Tax=Streptomyces actinomycinicus TaxID=1695166 RepID=A0A937JQW4_9ACTN|nr:FtsK/SpoIIIE domain-containing protein [Streptomyces actinomycinicus]MBL1087130.1 FHA domain-containing protein [Streptomyces actinomycinicus]